MKKALGYRLWTLGVAIALMLGSAHAGILQGGDFAAGVVDIEMAGGNTADFWFTPKLVGHGRISETVTTGTITNYEDIITYDAHLKPLGYDLGYDIAVGTLPDAMVYSSVDGVFEVDADTGEAISQVDGLGEVELSSGGVTRRIELSAQAKLPGMIGEVERLGDHIYLDGTVKKHVNETFAALIAGHDGSDADLALYSLQDHAATNYVRNTNCWAYSLDLTCASPWNSTGDGAAASRTGLPSGQFRAATLITPRHMLSSNHYHIRQTWPGSDTSFKVRFVDADNNVYTRTAIAHQTITNRIAWPPEDISPDGPTHAPDFVVLRLDEALPAAITPAKRLPDDWASYMPYTQGFTNALTAKLYNENFPIVMTDQQERATIAESFTYGCWGNAGLSADYGLYGEYWRFTPYRRRFGLFERRPTYEAFYRDKIVGDSSSPQLLYINGEAVLVGTLTTGGGGSSWTPLVSSMGDIQDIITNTFGDTNIWEAVDLTGFRTFERED